MSDPGSMGWHSKSVQELTQRKAKCTCEGTAIDAYCDVHGAHRDAAPLPPTAEQASNEAEQHRNECEQCNRSMVGENAVCLTCWNRVAAAPQTSIGALAEQIRALGKAIEKRQDQDREAFSSWISLAQQALEKRIHKSTAALLEAIQLGQKGPTIPAWLWEPFTNDKGEPLICSICDNEIPRIDNGWHGDDRKAGGKVQHTDCSYQQQIKELSAEVVRLRAKPQPSGKRGPHA